MTRLLLYIFSGALGVLAFSPFNLWWMSLVSLSLLLFLLNSNQESHAFRAGYLYGLGMFGFGVSWVFNSLYDFGNAPWVAAAVMTLVAALVLSLFPAGVVKLYMQLSSRVTNSVLQMLLFTCLWVLFEWLRSWVLTGFPWLLMGHILVDSPFTGIIPVLGVFGGSTIIAMISASIFQALTTNSISQTKWLVFIGIFIALNFSLNNISWTQAAIDEPKRVAAVQANIPFEMKWDKSRRNEVYQIYVDLTSNYWDSEIIVWPETAIPTFYRVANQDFIPLFEKQLKQHDVELISGVFTYEPGSERIFNSLVTLGNETQIYSKQHLVPFGEYLPLRWIFEFFRSLVTIPMSDLSAGEGSSVVTLKDVPVGVSICYEAAYGNEINHALPEAQLLINVTNDAWFGDSLAPHQHLQIARTRSLETGRYMIRAANTGISAIIDSSGRVTEQSGQFTDAVVSGDIWPITGSTPFVRWGNWVIISSLSVLLLIILATQRKSPG